MQNKPRLVEVTDEALTAMDEAQQANLDTPYVWRDGGDLLGRCGRVEKVALTTYFRNSACR